MSQRVLVTARYFSLDSEATRRLAADGIDVIASRFGGSAADSDATHHELRDLLSYADAVIRGLAPIDSELIALSSHLKIISIRGVGTDGIDLAAAKQKGVLVTITPGAMDRAVGEHAVAMMFDLVRNITLHDRAVRTGKWQAAIGGDIVGSTVGVIGLGRIGKEMALVCRSLGLRVLGFTRTPDSEWAQTNGVELVSLHELLAQSDLVSVHCSLSADSHHLIGRAELNRMKRSAFIVNTARGAIVDEEALVEALESSAIAGAALDVFDSEPLPLDHALRRLPNVILSPHVSGFTRGSLARSNNQAACNVADALAGRPLAVGVRVV